MDITINDINKLETFTNLFQHLKLFTGSINIHCNEEQMYIQTMDSSTIIIIMSYKSYSKIFFYYK